MGHKRAVAILLILLLLTHPPLQAQDSVWCGYMLVEGLSLLVNQLSGLESITPPRNRDSQPDQLFQYRFSLDHKKVIIEGCWRVEPKPLVLASLLAGTFNLTQNQINSLITAGIIPASDVNNPDQAALDFVKATMSLTIINRSGTRRDGAAIVRSYIQAHLSEWE